MSNQSQQVGSPATAQTGPTREPKRALFEPVALVLLSLATVGTAWCSFQAAAWGGVAGGFTNRSVAASRSAAANELKYTQVGLLDVLLFSQHINARASSNEVLARFYADRFRNEARTAFDAWMATKPFENPNAPPHPFVTNLYQPRVLEEARQKQIESEQLAQKAGEAGRISRNYILITVLLACALFSGGTAPKFDQRRIRMAVLAVGLAAFAFAVERLWLLPVQL
ncbi:MAG TPA: hypothetical protein VL361_18785 [Candidatus Limnocylindrales bacterium]|jgi:hypothetical protein|nr:hypothetical protein [Candidatus Limnocylindrales bacterium]